MQLLLVINSNHLPMLYHIVSDVGPL